MDAPSWLATGEERYEEKVESVKVYKRTEKGMRERATNRGPGSGPFLGGLDCLAAVAMERKYERWERKWKRDEKEREERGPRKVWRERGGR